jgi:hypothetical protein
MFEVLSNQYIPRKGRSLPNGYPACATYYYVVNKDGKTISKKTKKPYRGKELTNFWFHSEELANEFCNELNKTI